MTPTQLKTAVDAVKILHDHYVKGEVAVETLASKWDYLGQMAQKTKLERRVNMMQAHDIGACAFICRQGYRRALRDVLGDIKEVKTRDCEDGICECWRDICDANKLTAKIKARLEGE